MSISSLADRKPADAAPVTVMIGRHSSVQGEFAGRRADGRVGVRVGSQVHVGRPIPDSPPDTPAFD